MPWEYQSDQTINESISLVEQAMRVSVWLNELWEYQSGQTSVAKASTMDWYRKCCWNDGRIAMPWEYKYGRMIDKSISLFKQAMLVSIWSNECGKGVDHGLVSIFLLEWWSYCHTMVYDLGKGWQWQFAWYSGKQTRQLDLCLYAA